MDPGFFQCPETPLPHNGLVTRRLESYLKESPLSPFSRFGSVVNVFASSLLTLGMLCIGIFQDPFGYVGAVVCGVLVVVFVLIAMAANGKHADEPGSKPRAPRGKGSEIVHNYPSAPADKPRF